MPIKFQCPHCKKALTARDELAGKKAVCNGCKKPLTIPPPAPPPAAAPPAVAAKPPSDIKRAAAPAPPPKPKRPNLDVEELAASLLSDQPAGAAAAPEVIEFTCEYCDAPVRVAVALAGKREPCPECRRILKVPLPKKVEEADWRRAGQHLPSGARRDDAAPEGAWGTAVSSSVVSHEALEEAEAIPEISEPATLGQKIWVSVKVAAAAVLVGGLCWGAWAWMSHGREERSVRDALAYADNPAAVAEVGREGVAALHSLVGEYCVRARQPANDAPMRRHPGSAVLARDQFDRALALLRDVPEKQPAEERDAVLGEMAQREVELAGDKPEVEELTRLDWDATQKQVQAALAPIRDPEPRLDAYRAVSRRLIARGEAKRVLPLASAVFGARPAEQPAAVAAAGLEFLDAGQPELAAKAAEQSLAAYEAKGERPPVAASVVALALALGKKPPKGEKGIEEDAEWVGTAEGLARQGKWPQARAMAQPGKTPDVRLRVLLALAEAAAARGPAGDSTDVTTAAQLVSTEPSLRGSAGLGWVLLRLAQAGARGGLPPEPLQKLADAVAEPPLRGRAQLAILRVRLAQADGGVDPAPLAEAVADGTVARNLAWADIARHNTRLDGGFAGTVRGWPERQRAFGSAGVALGLRHQD
jgi:hypothetical protein